MVLRLLTLVVLLTVLSANVNAETYVLKFATLVPTGTSWTNLLDDWAKEVEKKSKGRLKLKMYPGGVMGDEPDVLRKIRKGQLHGGMFTGYGIGRIYSPARVLEVPFLFKNTRESDYVRKKIMPELEAGFRKKGFELLGWPEVGFIHFFSKQPVKSIDDLRKSKIWLWQGDPLGAAFFKAAKIKPVPLSIVDVYTQLSAKHGSIDTIYSSSFGAIALQWYSKLNYASEIAFTNAIGGLLVSNTFYNKLPKDLQLILKTTGKRLGDDIRMQARKENKRSQAILKKNGIKFMFGWSDVNMSEMTKIRDLAAKQLAASNYIPAANFSRVKKHLSNIRR